MPALPSGTVTFLFTDIEGSTHLLQQAGAQYATLLSMHQALLRAACTAHEGHEVDTQGDAFLFAFARAPEAVAAAAAAQQALAAAEWPEGGVVRVRMGLHTGSPTLVRDHYVGLDVHRAARIAASGHGGQVLLSQTTCGLVEDALPDGVLLRDLGAHRLKDLQHPEHCYQLVVLGLPAEFPPLTTLDTYRHNLPLQPTPLLGRAELVAAVDALVRRDNVRLVTLTGPGGIGKTRVALQVAAELIEAFLDGVWLVRLSRLVDPVLVLPTIAQTLGLKEQGSQPLAQTLRDHVADRQLLLVLDNFEQVVGAAPEVAALLAASPGLCVLVTSRLPLRLRGEKVYPVPPLSLAAPGQGPLPPLDQLTQYAAVALFIARARDAQPDFVVTAANAPAIAEVCARLDGVPLAIELAAARARLLPPEALLARLAGHLHLLSGGPRDLEERQQTMRATLAWSEELLSPPERVLFRRLSVFVGGCTLEAAETVCVAPAGATPLEMDLLVGLGDLVDQSLVQQRAAGEEDGEPRFGMLHVIREYALERLEQLEASAGGDGGREVDALQAAHAAYFVALAEREWAAEEAGAAVDAVEAATHVERLEPEQDNLRAALIWLQAQAEAAGRASGAGHASARRVAIGRGGGVEAPVVQGLRLAGALLWSWAFRGQLGEGRAWLEAFLALDATLDAPLDRALDVSARGTAGKRTAADEPGSGPAPRAARRSGRTTAARSASLAFVRARALYAAGVLAYWQGDTVQAVLLLEQSLAGWQALDDRRGVGYALNNLGMALQDQGDLGRARACYEQSLALGRALRRQDLIGLPLSNLASLALTAGDLEQAAVYSEEALNVCLQAHDHVGAAGCLIVQALIAWRRGHLSRAATLAAEALVLHHGARDERHYGDGLEVCALILATQGRAQQAARLLGAATTARERIGMRRQLDKPTEGDLGAAVVAQARAALGEERWAAAFAVGRALPLDQAIAEALRAPE
jgi:predicted ATPase/class 3 adenylate cyclase